MSRRNNQAALIFFVAAHRFFIASAIRFRPAGIMQGPSCVPAVLGRTLFSFGS